MTRSAATAALGCLCLLLVACGGNGSDPPAANPPTTSAAQESDVLAVCEGFIGDGGPEALISRVPVALTGIGPELGQDRTLEIAGISQELRLLIMDSPPALAAQLRTVQEPFQQVEAAMYEAGGHLELDTSNVRPAAFQIMEDCAEAGYRVD